jgi:hypothetical protein
MADRLTGSTLCGSLRTASISRPATIACERIDAADQVVVQLALFHFVESGDHFALDFCGSPRSGPKLSLPRRGQLQPAGAAVVATADQPRALKAGSELVHCLLGYERFGRTFSFRDPDGYVLTAHDAG